MKKVISIFILACMLLSSIVITSSAAVVPIDLITNTNTYIPTPVEVHKFTTPPDIDGVITTEEWVGEASVTFGVATAATTGYGPFPHPELSTQVSADNSFWDPYYTTLTEEQAYKMNTQVWFRYDENNLYVAAKVYDVTGPCNKEASDIESIWNGDNIEFTIDPEGPNSGMISGVAGFDGDPNYDWTTTPFNQEIFNYFRQFDNVNNNYRACWIRDIDKKNDFVFALDFYADEGENDFGYNTKTGKEYDENLAITVDYLDDGTCYINYEVYIPWADIFRSYGSAADAVPGKVFGAAFSVTEAYDMPMKDYWRYYDSCYCWGGGHFGGWAQDAPNSAGGTNAIVLTDTVLTPYQAPVVDDSFNGEGLLYTLDGEIVDDQLHVKLDLSDNDEGLIISVLNLLYNKEALEFVSVDAANSVYSAADFTLMEAGKLLVYGEGDLNNLENTYANGEVLTAVFNILDPEADFNFDLVVKDNDPENHINVDADWNPQVVKFTFAKAEGMPENGIIPPKSPYTVEVSGKGIDGQLHVYFDIKNNPGIWSTGFEVGYNADAFELAEVVNGGVFGDEDIIYSVENGVINFFVSNEASVEDVTGNGRLVEMVFNVKDYDADHSFTVGATEGNSIDSTGADVGFNIIVNAIEKLEKPEPTTVTVTVDGVATEYEIGAEVKLHAPQILKNGVNFFVFKNWVAEGVELTDATAQDITFVVPANDVVLTTNRYLHGDVDNNGKLTATDAILLKKLIKNPASLTEQQKATANGDVDLNGKVTATDYIAEKRKLKEKENYNYSKYEVVEVEA